MVFSTVRRSPVWAPCTPARRPPAPCWPRSRYPAKSARNKMLTACTRHCWMPVFSPLRLIPTSRPWAGMCWGCRWVCGDYAPIAAARNAHYCYTRVTKADTSGIEADLEVLDEHGAVLLSVQGLRLGTGASESAHNDRLLAERLLTIEWRQRELPELDHADAGTWLLISTTATADVVATALTDALKNHGAQCTTMCWPLARRPPLERGNSLEIICVPVDSAVW